MKDWGKNVKKRRAEQMKLIQQGVASESSSFYPSPWDTSESEVSWSAKPKLSKEKKKFPKWLMQLFVSLLLFGFTYTVFQSESGKAQEVQRWMLQWMNQPFHFQKVSNWYEKFAGGNAAILPTFSTEEKKPDSYWIAPVQGALALPFSPERKGILLKSKKNAQVKSPTDGLVIYAGERKGLGKTIVIQHASGKQTWYGFLGKVNVKEKSWVKKGAGLGTVGLRDGKPFIYIAYRENGKFMNPLEVMPFAY